MSPGVNSRLGSDKTVLLASTKSVFVSDVVEQSCIVNDNFCSMTIFTKYTCFKK